MNLDILYTGFIGFIQSFETLARRLLLLINLSDLIQAEFY